MKYIDAEKLIALIDTKLEDLGLSGSVWVGRSVLEELKNDIITSLQQEQPDFDDVDPKHLVHSHYTKVRETKTGRVFWAEYSSEAAEWYEAGTGKAYSISKVEIVKEPPEVDLEKEIEKVWETFPPKILDYTAFAKLVTHFYELGFNTRKEESNEIR